MPASLYKLLLLWITLTPGLSISSLLSAQPGWNHIDSTTFVHRFPNAKLLDHGKVNLYSYRDYEGNFKGLGNSEKLLPTAGALFLEIFDSPVDYFFVQINGRFEEVKTEKAFREKIGDWFADDTALLEYIRTEKIKSEFLPYLIRMYNGHARRPFETDSANSSIEFITDGLLDTRDGRLYDILTVNNITWMAENLRFSPWTNITQDTTYGIYYTWEGAMHVCPSGWRLPDETDWKTLYLGLGIPLKRVDKNGFYKDSDLCQKMLKDSANPKGFNAIRQDLLKGSAFFWSAQEASDKRAIVVEISPSNKVTDYNSFKKTGGVNVRCVKKW